MDSYRKAEPRRKALSRPGTEKVSEGRRKDGHTGARKKPHRENSCGVGTWQSCRDSEREAGTWQSSRDSGRGAGTWQPRRDSERGAGTWQPSRDSGRAAGIQQPCREDRHAATVKENVCPYAKKCGGCDFQGVPYKRQLQKKDARIRYLLKDTVRRIHPIIGMETPLHYRCKVHAVFSHDRKGNPISGIYEKNSHVIVPMDSCMIEDEGCDRIIVSIRSLLRSFKIRTFDEDTGYGLLRHVLVRKGYATGEYLVVLVVADPVFPSRNNFVKALRKDHPEITSIVLNINDKSTSMVLGERNITLYGPGFIVDELCGHRFRISPNSFYQVNPAQTELLYRTAIRYAHLTGKEEVLDAYCGTGTIGIIASDQAGHVTGVELNSEAVKDAISNARAEKLKNVDFICADAGEYLNQLTKAVEAEETEGGFNGRKAVRRKNPGVRLPDVIIMDPPRSGSTPQFIRAAAFSGVKRIVYISCGPESLARDLELFEELGYAAEEAQPVDLFPFTQHVETVVLMSRK
ncbi:23S rRNA (uracil(1939)-C(5))-methyltransferase RlmD [Porcincola sp. LCP21S3_C12]|uniref:23S rRNA (uracil(1939)-C(5))-methyltransferase RlmD n=1 Tax=Porcincola sp. LCP21S3_C12 TaxID=3438798 RepID=UPI003F9E7AD8